MRRRGGRSCRRSPRKRWARHDRREACRGRGEGRPGGQGRPGTRTLPDTELRQSRAHTTASCRVTRLVTTAAGAPTTPVAAVPPSPYPATGGAATIVGRERKTAYVAQPPGNATITVSTNARGWQPNQRSVDGHWSPQPPCQDVADAPQVVCHRPILWPEQPEHERHMMAELHLSHDNCRVRRPHPLIDADRTPGLSSATLSHGTGTASPACLCGRPTPGWHTRPHWHRPRSPRPPPGRASRRSPCGRRAARATPYPAFPRGPREAPLRLPPTHAACPGPPECTARLYSDSPGFVRCAAPREST